jgi:putative ABC transport system substrate-binding protein
MQSGQLKRREFITLVAAAAVSWPLAAQAQEPGRIYRLAFLLPSPRQAPQAIAMFDELRRNGFNEGQNLEVIPGGFDTDPEHPGELPAALVKEAPDAIITGSAIALRTFQSITQTIPLIGFSEDMVAEGLIASFARPGGNITGISLLSPELDGKRQEILIEAVPGARRIAAIADDRRDHHCPPRSNSVRRQTDCAYQIFRGPSRYCHRECAAGQ